MKRYIVDEENLRYLRNTRIVFTAKSTQDINIEQVFIYDNDVSDMWFDVSVEYLASPQRKEKLVTIACDYLEELLNQPIDDNNRGTYGDKRY